MPLATDFQPMLSSVITSQQAEVTLGKQSVLAAHGREVRTAISALPPELSRGLVGDYQAPTPGLIAALGDAIVSREVSIGNAAQEVNIDRQWLADVGHGRSVNEATVGAVDHWGPAA